jgi:hypothetical protein
MQNEFQWKKCCKTSSVTFTFLNCWCSVIFCNQWIQGACTCNAFKTEFCLCSLSCRTENYLILTRDTEVRLKSTNHLPPVITSEHRSIYDAFILCRSSLIHPWWAVGGISAALRQINFTGFTCQCIFKCRTIQHVLTPSIPFYRTPNWYAYLGLYLQTVKTSDYCINIS